MMSDSASDNDDVDLYGIPLPIDANPKMNMDDDVEEVTRKIAASSVGTISFGALPTMPTTPIDVTGPTIPTTLSMKTSSLGQQQQQRKNQNETEVCSGSLRRFVWKLRSVPTLPERYPLELTAIFIPYVNNPSVVTERISAVLQERSIEAHYNDLLAKVKCLTVDGVDFRIRLYRGRGRYNHGIIVEVQRRFGTSFAFHNDTQAILDGAQGKVPPSPPPVALLPPTNNNILPRFTDEDEDDDDGDDEDDDVLPPPPPPLKTNKKILPKIIDDDDDEDDEDFPPPPPPLDGKDDGEGSSRFVVNDHLLLNVGGIGAVMVQREEDIAAVKDMESNGGGNDDGVDEDEDNVGGAVSSGSSADADSSLAMVGKMLKVPGFDSQYLGLQILSSLVDSEKLWESTARAVATRLLQDPENEVGSQIFRRIIDNNKNNKEKKKTGGVFDDDDDDEDSMTLRNMCLNILAKSLFAYGTTAVVVPDCIIRCNESLCRVLLQDVKDAERHPNTALLSAKCLEYFAPLNDHSSNLYDCYKEAFDIAQRVGAERHSELFRQAQKCMKAIR